MPPLLHRMEERAGERRRVLFRIPLSSVLSPFVPHGERRKTKFLDSLLCFSGRHFKRGERNGAMGCSIHPNFLLVTHSRLRSKRAINVHRPLNFSVCLT